MTIDKINRIIDIAESIDEYAQREEESELTSLAYDVLIEVKEMKEEFCTTKEENEEMRKFLEKRGLMY